MILAVVVAILLFTFLVAWLIRTPEGPPCSPANPCADCREALARHREKRR